MIESGDYPAGAEYSKDAPYNEHLPKPKKIKTTVSMTLSKEVELIVDDYIVEEVFDKDYHGYHEDFSDCDLKAAARDQVYLPDEAGDNIEYLRKLVKTDPKHYELVSKRMIDELKDWNVDDFEVVYDGE